MAQLIQSIYTDGACSGNPGPGGWGTVVYFRDDGRHEMGGGAGHTTNNRMEMQAAVAALEFYVNSGQTQPIALYTDSEYVKNGITKWIRGWKSKGWKGSTGKPVLNQDLWEQLDALNSSRVDWRYVRGHSGDEGNERCDTIARAYSHGRVPDLRSDLPSPPPKSPKQAVPQAQPATQAELSLDLPTPAIAAIPQSVAKSIPEAAEESAIPESSATPKPSAPSSTLSSTPSSTKLKPGLVQAMEKLRIANEIATEGYLITTAELAELVGEAAGKIADRVDPWTWRNWTISKVRQEGKLQLWQIERVD
jgi:ribonuclease HI